MEGLLPAWSSPSPPLQPLRSPEREARFWVRVEFKDRNFRASAELEVKGELLLSPSEGCVGVPGGGGAGAAPLREPGVEGVEIGSGEAERGIGEVLRVNSTGVLTES